MGGARSPQPIYGKDGEGYPPIYGSRPAAGALINFFDNSLGYYLLVVSIAFH